MTKKSARALALELLRRVQHGAFSAPVLSAALEKYPLSQQDKGFLTDLLYGTLRQQIFLDACLAPKLKAAHKLPENIYNILRLGAYELLIRQTAAHAAVHVWVEVAKRENKRLSGLVNAVLRRLAVPDTLTDWQEMALPAWLWQEWQGLFAADIAKDMAQGMNHAEPLWLQSYHAEAVASLEAQGCTVSAPFFEDSLAVQAPLPLGKLEAFQQGWLQAQNASSSFPVRLFADVKGKRVLDLCSGNGIKAAQLAQRGAEVVSIEVQPKKLARAEKNLQRLGLQVQALAWDLRTLPDTAPADYVLLDAPCSGTGTLRGNPEIRQRVTSEQVAALATLQLELLHTAAQLTKAGGSLLYVVCALTRAESLGVVSKFLAQQPDFAPQTFDCPLPHQAEALGTFILPVAGLDGFFISYLRKT